MLYKDNRSIVEVLPKFLYEISIYVIFKKRAELLYSKMISSNKELKIKKDVKIVEKTKNYTIVKYLELLGAPQSYMERKGFKLVE